MKTVLALLMLVSGGAALAQPADDRSLVIQEIVRTLAEIGFTNYAGHFDEGYLVSQDDNDWASKNTEIGLNNLISMCLQSDKSKWHAIVAGYFQNAKNIRKEAEEVDPKLQQFATAADFLRVRLYPLNYLSSIKDAAVFRRNPLGFLEVVVVNYPSTVGTLRKEYLARWGKSADEVLQAATAATLNENKETYQRFPFKYDSVIYLMTSSQNLFVTTDLLDAGLKGAPVGKFGSFVSVPNRINMPVLVLDDKDMINALTMEFMMLTRYMYEQGPGSISRQFFWFDGKTLYPVENDPEKGRLKLPDPLIDRLTAQEN